MDAVPQEIPKLSKSYFTKIIFWISTILIVALVSGIVGYEAGLHIGKLSQEKKRQALLPSPTRTVVVISQSPAPVYKQVPITISQPSQGVASQPSPTPASQADNIVQTYYNWYLSCMNQHFEKANTDAHYNQSPQEACPYNQTGVLSDTLVNTLQQAKGYDPVLCAQNTPQTLTFDKAVFPTNGTATVVAHTIWGTSTPQNIQVGLQLISNQWKMTSITCHL